MGPLGRQGQDFPRSLLTSTHSRKNVGRYLSFFLTHLWSPSWAGTNWKLWGQLLGKEQSKKGWPSGGRTDIGNSAAYASVTEVCCGWKNRDCASDLICKRPTRNTIWKCSFLGGITNIWSLFSCFLHSPSLKVYSNSFLSFPFCGMEGSAVSLGSSLLKAPPESSLSHGESSYSSEWMHSAGIYQLSIDMEITLPKRQSSHPQWQYPYPIPNSSLTH